MILKLKLSAALASLTVLGGVLCPCLHAQVGGGYAGGGIVGEYFSNVNLTGSPAFVRSEVRLDFDWSTNLPVGGAIEEPYKSFPLDNFSVRYTGTVIAAFSESYTFKTVADDGVRLCIRPAGGGGWTTLIDQWTTPGTNTATYALTKGSRYDVRVEYHELTGSARLRLLWSSASTPEEVIDPVMSQGFNVTFWSYGYADLVKGGNRNVWDPFPGKPAVMVDTNGWPQSDAMFYFMESGGAGLDLDPLAAGMINYSFNGSGLVTIAGNVDQATLTQSYNAVSNLTTGTFQTQANGQGNMLFKVKATDRDGISPARSNGFTNLKLLIPRTPGGTNPYPAGTIFTDQFRAACSNFTVLRVDLGNQVQESAWSDRTPPAWFNQSAVLTSGGRSVTNYFPIYPGTFPNGASLEYKIMLCNESGRDLYLNLPVLATGWSSADTNGYVNKVARLIRYGSDGVEPYSGPTAHPLYPPLNPNLRVYLEFGNEIWNSSYRQYGDIIRMVRSDADAYLYGTNLVSVTRSNDFPILNYDNLSTSKTTDYASIDTWRKRKGMLRILQISDIFRATFGDAAMGARIRPIFEWQYDNLNATASTPLKFAEDYFNNGDGINHVATPHPVNYYLWGGGGATYYGAVNGYGVTTQLVNSSFETPVVANGYTQAPAGATWNFTGTAGIARDAGGSDDIPLPYDGSQMGYIAGTGSMSISVTIPATQTSDRYAFVFKTLQRVTAAGVSTNAQKLRLFINGVESNWESFNQTGGYKPTAYNATYPWSALVVYWTSGTPYYSSVTFTAAPSSTVTLRLEGTTNVSEIAFIEDVQLCSVDKIFADGMPGGGEANGQPAGSAYQATLDTESSWALAFGLNSAGYEGGWSLGGDTGGTPLQNYAKYKSAEAGPVNANAIDRFHQSGGVLNTFGTYSLWPSWKEDFAEAGLSNVNLYPLIISQADRMNNLRAEVLNGVPAPNTLTGGNAELLSSATTAGSVTVPGWLSWNAISPNTATYTIAITTTNTGGPAQLFVDGATNGDSFTTGGTVTRTALLTKGVHGLRLRGLGGNFTVSQIVLSVTGAPAAPAITNTSAGSGSITLQCGLVSGATGYVVRWGTASGVYPYSMDVGLTNSHTFTGLSNGQDYFFTVVAYNATGYSLPSAVSGIIGSVDGAMATLARWEFVGNTGLETNVAAATATARLTVSGVTRGQGFKLPVSGDAQAVNAFAYYATNSYANTSSNLPQAMARGEYSTFTLTPKPGTILSVSNVMFAPYWLDLNYYPSAGVAWSLNGGAFTLVTNTGTLGIQRGEPLNADFSGVAALQFVTNTLTLRLVQSGIHADYFAGIGRQILAVPADDIVVSGSVTSTVAPPPPSVTLGVQPVGGSLQLNWSQGVLLEANEVTGPWTTNNAASPHLVTPTAERKFYRVQVQ